MFQRTVEVLVSNTGFTMSKYFIAPGKTQKMKEGALKTQLDGGRQVEEGWRYRISVLLIVEFSYLKSLLSKWS